MGHPYGIEPRGNAALYPAISIRDSGFGNISVLNDEIILNLWSFLDGYSVGKCASVSKSFYAVCHIDDVWKYLVLELVHGLDEKFHLKPLNTWRETFISLTAEGKPYILIPHKPLKISGLFSDIFYQPYLYASSPIDYQWLCHDNVIREKNLSVESFRRNYETPNIPVIITDVVSNWAAYGKWSKSFFLNKYGNMSVHAAGTSMFMRDYISYADVTQDDMPLTIFDKKFVEKEAELCNDYEIPEYFSDDYFKHLEDRRPDYRWLIIGPTKSGSTFHVDPNSTSAWNAVLVGSKKWILFPPDLVPPGIHPSDDHLSLAAPISVMEWFVNYYHLCKPYARKRKIESREGAIFECTTKAGEVIFVPRGWWHCVLNLEFTVAITQNFVSRVNLRPVLSYLKCHPNNVSGLPSNERSELYKIFLDKLKALPEMHKYLHGFMEERVISSRSNTEHFSFSFNI